MALPSALSTFTPAALVVALLSVVAALAWTASGGARARQRGLRERVTRLEQQMSEQLTALQRSEAQRSALEADLRATEQRYTLALRGSQDGLWEWDIGSGAVHLSPRWKGMLGFDADELGNDVAAWRARVHPDDRAAFEAALQRHVDGTDARFDHEMRLLHKDGSARHVLSRGAAIRHDTGHAYRMVGMDTDVTRLRRVQAVLDAVADGTAGTSGAQFFEAMVQQFARALEVDVAFLAECIDQPVTRVRTLAYWSTAVGTRDSFEFALAGTPCEQVLNEGRACFHPQGVAEMFPREAGYQAYLGMPVIASDGRVLGHLALFNKRPLGDEVLVDRVYRIFLARAAAEIEKMQALARLALAAPAA